MNSVIYLLLDFAAAALVFGSLLAAAGNWAGWTL